VLQGFAMTAATVLVGCAVESEPPPPEPTPGIAVTMCGSQLCLDLNDTVNARLAAVDGTAVIMSGRATILLVRSSETTVDAVSNICTHAGCTVAYIRSTRILACPCHGSQFSLTGAVLNGPATEALQRYTAQLDEATNQLRITV
jgi:cytochrome b6-f complex iron-sulfur subunit